MVDSTHHAVLIEPAQPAHSIDLLVKAWLAGYSSHYTRVTYLAGVTQWLDWCRTNQMNPLQVRKTHFDLYLRHLETLGLAQNTRAIRMTSVASWYGWLFDEEILDADPTVRVRTPSTVHRDDLPWADQFQLRNLLLSAPDVLNVDEFGALCSMALCAMRVGEVGRADHKDLTSRRWVPQLVVHGKGAKDRTIDVPPQAMEAFVATGREVGPLFVNRAGNRMTQSNLGRIVTKAAEAAKLDDLGLTPHALRRSWATIALHNGAPLRDVQMYLGHANSATTVLYDRRDDLTMKSPTWLVQQAVA